MQNQQDCVFPVEAESQVDFSLAIRTLAREMSTKLRGSFRSTTRFRQMEKFLPFQRFRGKIDLNRHFITRSNCWRPTDATQGRRDWLRTASGLRLAPQQHCCQQHRASLSGGEHVQQRHQRRHSLGAVCRRWWMLAVVIVDLPPGRWIDPSGHGRF